VTDLTPLNVQTTLRYQQAWFDGFRSGLANEVDDWNASDEDVRKWAKEYVARRAAQQPSDV